MRGKKISWGFLISLLIFVSVLAAVISGVRAADRAAGEEAMRTLQSGIRRAAVTCYAIEGRYPATLDYLAREYGVYIDESRFVVHYEVFASNIMPDVTVLAR